MFAELISILSYNFNHLDFIHESVDLGFDCPLDLHCSYTRDQILVAMDYMSTKRILLFVREFKQDLAGAAPYTFLGLADYVTHEGSKPMSITWRLHRPIPAKYLKKTNKLVVG